MISKITGLTPYTIRYYAKEGLLPLVERSNNGTRLFKESDLEYLYMIGCLKNCGMTIKEIREFTEWTLEGDSTIDKRLKLFQEKKKVLTEKLKIIQTTLDTLNYKEWYYTVAKKAGTVAVHDTMPEDEIPEEMKKIRLRMTSFEGYPATKK